MTATTPARRRLTIRLTGKLKSGKNGMRVHPVTGVHYPTPEFKLWRAGVESQIRRQLVDVPRVVYQRAYRVRGRTGLKELVPVVFAEPVSAVVRYTPGDLLSRDVPGMVDALWHVLERVGVVGNDVMIESANFVRMPLDRERPGCEIELTGL